MANIEKFTWEGTRVFIKKSSEAAWALATHRVSNVLSANISDGGTTIINGNDLDSLDRVTEKVPGHTDPGTLSIVCNVTKANSAKIEELETIRFASTSSGTLVDVAIIAPFGMDDATAVYRTVCYKGCILDGVNKMSNTGSDAIQQATINLVLRNRPEAVPPADVTKLMADDEEST